MTVAARGFLGLVADLRSVADVDASGVTDPIALPAVPGGYLLLARLATALRLEVASLPAATLLEGWYVYAGSARGPGGIRARAGRHLRRGKRPHWHVDYLTEAAADLWVFAAPGGSECDLLRRLLARPAFDTALPRFGSSDCRLCVSHLLAVRPGDVGQGRHRPEPGRRRTGAQFK